MGFLSHVVVAVSSCVVCPEGKEENRTAVQGKPTGLILFVQLPHTHYHSFILISGGYSKKISLDLPRGSVWTGIALGARVVSHYSVSLALMVDSPVLVSQLSFSPHQVSRLLIPSRRPALALLRSAFVFLPLEFLSPALVLNQPLPVLGRGGGR